MPSLIDPMMAAPAAGGLPIPELPPLVAASAANPVRPAHWRWDRAGALRAAGKPAGSREDPWVRRAYRFRGRLEAAAGPAEVQAIHGTDPDLYLAYVLWAGRDDDRHKTTVHAIEARLLAGEGFAAAAAHALFSPAVVETYARVFYDVTDVLDRTDYICTQVIGPALYRGVRDRHYDLLWKLIAYTMGGEALEAMIATMMPGPRGSGATLAAAFNDRGKLNMAMKFLLATRIVPVHEGTAIQIMDVHTRALTAEQARGSGGGGQQEVVLGMIGQVLSHVGFHAGRPERSGPVEPGGLELRGDQLLSIPDGAVPDLEVPTFPRARPEGDEEDTS